MKKILSGVFIALIFCFGVGVGSFVFLMNNDAAAAQASDLFENLEEDENISVGKKENAASALGSNAISCVLADFDSGTIIYEKNSHAKVPIASVTKIMTLLVAYDAVNEGKCSLSDQVVISKNAASMGGSQAFLDANSVHLFKDLLKTIIIASANDSCVAIAEHVCGNVETFVSKMNKKATEIGLTATNFVNCTGLPALNQYSCADDCVKMLCCLLRQENNYFEYSKIWLEDYKHPDGRITTLTNTNKLVRFFDGCDGGKTGFTNESKHCLCATAKRGDTRFVACVLGENDSKTRFAEVSAMLNYGFANYTNKVYLDFDDLDDISIKGGNQTSLKIAPENKLSYLSQKGQEDGACEVVIEINCKTAPITNGQVIGIAYLTKDGIVVGKTNILAKEDIEKKSYFDSLQNILSRW